MAYVAIVIDGWSTYVDVDLLFVEGFERFQPTSQRVIDLNG